jgi:hypothetical protein
MLINQIIVAPAVVVAMFFLHGCAAEDACEDCSLPATGQSNWYRNDGNVANCDDISGFDGAADVPPGQDGRFLAGCRAEGRFVANAGTVTDTCTNLIWQRSATAAKTWVEALVFARNQTTADLEDWRLPNINELLSIVDYGRSNPALDPVFSLPSADDVSAPDPLVFWSSTSFDFRPREGWIVNFAEGDHGPSGKDSARAVRAVRGGFIPRRLPVAACPGVIGS